MESCNLVHDGDSIMAALKALVELGWDGGLGNGRIWFLLVDGTKRVRELCPHDTNSRTDRHNSGGNAVGLRKKLLNEFLF